MKSAQLQKTLDGFEKKELIRLELARLRKDYLVWLETRFQPSGHMAESVEYYKKKISGGFDGKINLTVAKKAIRDFKKASNDRDILIDLMLLYVEEGTELALAYVDQPYRFYSSLEGMYRDVVLLLDGWNDKNLLKKFRPRLRSLVTKTKDIGWGYHDALSEIYNNKLEEEE